MFRCSGFLSLALHLTAYSKQSYKQQHPNTWPAGSIIEHNCDDLAERHEQQLAQVVFEGQEGLVHVLLFFMCSISP